MAYNNVGRLHATLDAELILADFDTTTTGTTPVVGQVGGSAQILDIGGGRINGLVFVDVSAADISSSDEKYRFEIRLSNSATLASGIVVTGILEIGHNSALSGDTDLGAARYVLPLSNVVGNTAYRYAQIRLVPTGTTPSVTWGAWLNKNPFQ